MSAPRRSALALLLLLTLGCAAARRPAAESGSELLHDNPLVLVTLAPGEETRETAIADQLERLFGVRLAASWFMRSLGERCLVMIAPDWLTPERAAAEVRSHPAVTGAVPVRRYALLAAPDGDPDPYARLQQESLGLPLAELHGSSTGRGVSVAIVDTGLDFTHPDLAGRVERAVDFAGRTRGRFVGEAHGTAVAGIVAALEGNGIGGSGVAPGVDLWALRACWQVGPGGEAVCDSYTLAQAFDLVASERPRVVNLSLAGERDELLERLLEAAIASGVVVVAATDGEPLSFPASVRGVLAVRAAGRTGGPARRATTGGAALVAPGTDLLTTTPGGGFDFVSGSSFATAWASGVVALLLERDPHLAPRTVVDLLTITATRSEAGRRLDACGALARLVDGPVCATGGPPLESAAVASPP